MSGRPLVESRATAGRPLVESRATAGKPLVELRATAGRPLVESRVTADRPLIESGIPAERSREGHLHLRLEGRRMIILRIFKKILRGFFCRFFHFKLNFFVILIQF